MDIGMADPCGLDPNQNVLFTNCGQRDLLHLQRLPNLDQSNRFHGTPLYLKVPVCFNDGRRPQSFLLLRPDEPSACEPNLEDPS